MKIAIPYENGQVFPHFGRSEQFKIYTVSDDEILSTEIVTAQEAGHSAMVALLQEKGVNVLICGGIGVGAVTALKEARIQILGGASGEADTQVQDFLNGKIHFEAPGSPCCGTHACAGSGADDSISGSADGCAVCEQECDGNISACGHPCR